jgi:hypothetical protein
MRALVENAYGKGSTQDAEVPASDLGKFLDLRFRQEEAIGSSPRLEKSRQLRAYAANGPHERRGRVERGESIAPPSKWAKGAGARI